MAGNNITIVGRFDVEALSRYSDKRICVKKINLSYSSILFSNIFSDKSNCYLSQVFKDLLPIPKSYDDYLIAEPVKYMFKYDDIVINDIGVFAHNIDIINNYLFDRGCLYPIYKNIWLLAIDKLFTSHNIFSALDIINLPVSLYTADNIEIKKLLLELQMLHNIPKLKTLNDIHNQVGMNGIWLSDIKLNGYIPHDALFLTNKLLHDYGDLANLIYSYDVQSILKHSQPLLITDFDNTILNEILTIETNKNINILIPI